MINRLKMSQEMDDKETNMTALAGRSQSPAIRYRVLGMALLVFSSGVITAQTANHPVHNVVLVHGAWADGSGWRGVYDRRQEALSERSQ
jgi:hypothetical protein